MLTLAINTFCKELSPILKMIGDLLTIFKIALPLILIALCILDIGKAVISSKPVEIKKNIKNCAKKLVISVLIFFVPMLCMIVFDFVDGFHDIIEKSGLDFDVCYDCMFNPTSTDCKDAVNLAELSN